MSLFIFWIHFFEFCSFKKIKKKPSPDVSHFLKLNVEELLLSWLLLDWKNRLELYFFKKINRMQNETVFVQNKTVVKSFQLQFFEVLFLIFQFLFLQQDLLPKLNLEKSKTEPQKIAVETSSQPFYFAQRPFYFAFCYSKKKKKNT